MNLLLVKLLGSLLILAALAYGIHKYNDHQRDIGRNEIRAERTAEKLADKIAAEKIEKDWRLKYAAAIKKGAKNAQSLRAAAAVAGNANDSLRDTIAKLNEQLAAGSADTASQHAAAYQAVFADCVGRYRAMGEAAQGHAGDAATLEAAWPK